MRGLGNGLMVGGFLWAVLLSSSCTNSGSSFEEGQENWLRSCSVDSECGELSCLCGACTASCSVDTACGGVTGGASCVAGGASLARVLCATGGGQAPEQGLCMPTCRSEADCGTGQVCLGDVCVLSEQAQSLLGGAPAAAMTSDDPNLPPGAVDEPQAGVASPDDPEGGPVQAMGGDASGLPADFGRNKATGCWELGPRGVLVGSVASGDGADREAVRFMHTLVGDLEVAEDDDELVAAIGCLRHVTGNVVITGSVRDSAIPRFVIEATQLRQIGGDLRIEGTRAAQVSLQRLKQVWGDLVLLDNTVLINIGIWPLELVGGRIYIEGNPNLAGCDATELASRLGLPCECGANGVDGPCL